MAAIGNCHIDCGNDFVFIYVSYDLRFLSQLGYGHMMKQSESVLGAGRQQSD